MKEIVVLPTSFRIYFYLYAFSIILIFILKIKMI